MLTLAICDDNKNDLAIIAELISEWILQQKDTEIVIKQFTSPYALLDEVRSGKAFDLFLLDILMPEMTGISLGERLHTLLSDPLLIFLTSSEDYYSDAFRLYAFQYICKPIQKSSLFEVMDKVLLRCEKRRQNVFALKTANGIVQFPIHTLVYAELFRHICHFHLANGTNLQSQYLRTGFDNFIAPLLLDRRFIKTHTSFLVNLSFAGKLSQNNLTLTTGEAVPVTRTFADEVSRRYMEYALWVEGSKL